MGEVAGSLKVGVEAGNQSEEVVEVGGSSPLYLSVMLQFYDHLPFFMKEKYCWFGLILLTRLLILHNLTIQSF